MQKRRSPGLIYIVATLVFGLFSSHALSQSNKKPKLKDFGSSLKRLKWDPERQAAVETRSNRDSPKASPDDDVVKVQTSLVVNDIVVLDARGQPVQNLTERDFVVTEDGMAQKVGVFSIGDNLAIPKSIVLIIDYSGSQALYIQNSVAAAKVLIDKLGPADRMAIVTDDVELLVNFTTNKGKLKDALDSLVNTVERAFDFDPDRRHRRRYGLSLQYSALMAVLKEAFDAEDQRPIIVFQTDGDEVFFLRNPIIVPTIPPNLPPDLANGMTRALKVMRRHKTAEFSLTDLYKTVEQSRATIYTVVPGVRMIGLSLDEQIRQTRREWERLLASSVPRDRQVGERMKQQWQNTPVDALRFYASEHDKIQSALAVIATLAGGWTEFLELPSQADEIYSRIFSDINRRYIIGYYPTNKEHDGKRRKISIEVRDHPEYVVIGRKAYYAPEPVN